MSAHTLGPVLVAGGLIWALLGAVAYRLSDPNERDNRKLIKILLVLDIATMVVGALLLAV